MVSEEERLIESLRAEAEHYRTLYVGKKHELAALRIDYDRVRADNSDILRIVSKADLCYVCRGKQRLDGTGLNHCSGCKLDRKRG